MGTWYETCGISNLPIKGGESVVFLIIAENVTPSGVNCHPVSHWAPITLPMYAKYNECGSIHEWAATEKPILALSLEYFRQHICPGETRVAGEDVSFSKENLSVEAFLASLHDGSAKIPLYGFGEATCRMLLIRRDVWDSFLAMEDFTNFLGGTQSARILRSRIPALLVDVVNMAKMHKESEEPDWPFFLMSSSFEHSRCPLKQALSGRGAVSPLCELTRVVREKLTVFARNPSPKDRKYVTLLLQRYVALAAINYGFSDLRRSWQPTTAAGEHSKYHVQMAFLLRMTKIAEALELEERRSYE